MLQKRVKRTDGSLTCLQSTDLEVKETFNCLITYPAAQSYRSCPPQLPFIARRMKALFGRGDLRTKGLQILSCLRCPRSSAGERCEAWRGPRLCPDLGPPPRTCGRTRTRPPRVCETIFLIFWLAWQTAAAPSPELLSAFAQVPVSIQ